MDDGCGGGPRLELLGAFALTVDQVPISLPKSGRRVLAYLAVRRRPAPRSTVAGVLWPERPEDRALGNLRASIWRLPTCARRVIEDGGGQLRLASDVEVDVLRLIDRARTLVTTDRDSQPDVDSLAPDDLKDDLLPDWADDWVLAERARVRQIRLHALEALATGLSAADRFAEAVEAAAEAVRAEPLRESSVRLLAITHLRIGNIAEARRVVDRHTEDIRRELGVWPSPDLLCLIRGATNR